MPLIYNGTTVPTNVANTLNYNGSNVTAVIFNGTTVWTQSLFNAKWSGNSTFYTNFGFTVSNNLFRVMLPTSRYGAWITTNTNGTFTGSSSITNTAGGAYAEINTSSNLLRVRSGVIDGTAMAYTAYGAWVTFTVGTGFTGSSTSSKSGHNDDTEEDLYLSYNLGTSGGLIRAYGAHAGGVTITYGGYVSLT